MIAPARADEADGGHVVRIRDDGIGFSSPGTTVESWLPGVASRHPAGLFARASSIAPGSVCIRGIAPASSTTGEPRGLVFLVLRVDIEDEAHRQTAREDLCPFSHPAFVPAS